MKLTRIILVSCATLFFIGTFFYAYISSARVTGFEFNPFTWQIRHFEFYADPFTNKQLIGLDNTGPSMWKIDPAIVGTLKSSPPGATSRWDLIELDDFKVGTVEGPAAILVDLLTARRSGWQSTSVVHWADWTTNNPTDAALFWNAVQVLTIHGAYTGIPDLVDVSKLTGPELKNKIDQAMSKSLLARAKKLQSEGQLEAARLAAKDGVNYDSESEELTQIAEEQ